VAIRFDVGDGFIELGLIHGHEVTPFREAPTLDIIGVFLERSDALLLEKLLFPQKIPIRLGMVGQWMAGVSASSREFRHLNDRGCALAEHIYQAGYLVNLGHQGTLE